MLKHTYNGLDVINKKFSQYKTQLKSYGTSRSYFLRRTKFLGMIRENRWDYKKYYFYISRDYLEVISTILKQE